MEASSCIDLRIMGFRNYELGNEWKRLPGELTHYP
jgi:hypothetical protein